jgi:hypothetical protein
VHACWICPVISYLRLLLLLAAASFHSRAVIYRSLLFVLGGCLARICGSGLCLSICNACYGFVEWLI